MVATSSGLMLAPSSEDVVGEASSFGESLVAVASFGESAVGESSFRESSVGESTTSMSSVARIVECVGTSREGEVAGLSSAEDVEGWESGVEDEVGADDVDWRTDLEDDEDEDDERATQPFAT